MEGVFQGKGQQVKRRLHCMQNEQLCKSWKCLEAFFFVGICRHNNTAKEHIQGG